MSDKTHARAWLFHQVLQKMQRTCLSMRGPRIIPPPLSPCTSKARDALCSPHTVCGPGLLRHSSGSPAATCVACCASAGGALPHARGTSRSLAGTMGSMGQQPPGRPAAAMSSATRSSSVAWPGTMGTPAVLPLQVLLLLLWSTPSAAAASRAPASHAPGIAAAGAWVCWLGKLADIAAVDGGGSAVPVLAAPAAPPAAAAPAAHAAGPWLAAASRGGVRWGGRGGTRLPKQPSAHAACRACTKVAVPGSDSQEIGTPARVQERRAGRRAHKRAHTHREV